LERFRISERWEASLDLTGIGCGIVAAKLEY